MCWEVGGLYIFSFLHKKGFSKFYNTSYIIKQVKIGYNIGRASNNNLTGFTTQCQVLLYKLYSINQNDSIINYFIVLLFYIFRTSYMLWKCKGIVF